MILDNLKNKIKNKMNEICIEEEKKRNLKFKKLTIRNIDIPLTLSGFVWLLLLFLVLFVQFALLYLALKIAFVDYIGFERVVMLFFALYFTIPFLIVVGLIKAFS